MEEERKQKQAADAEKQRQIELEAEKQKLLEQEEQKHKKAAEAEAEEKRKQLEEQRKGEELAKEALRLKEEAAADASPPLVESGDEDANVNRNAESSLSDSQEGHVKSALSNEIVYSDITSESSGDNNSVIENIKENDKLDTSNFVDTVDFVDKLDTVSPGCSTKVESSVLNDVQSEIKNTSEIDNKHPDGYETDTSNTSEKFPSHVGTLTQTFIDVPPDIASVEIVMDSADDHRDSEELECPEPRPDLKKKKKLRSKAIVIGSKNRALRSREKYDHDSD